MKVTSEKVGHQIEELQLVHDSKVEEYRNLESTVPEEEAPKVKQERLSLRPVIEKEFESDKSKIKFRLEADRIDKKLGCTISELSGEHDLALKPKFKRTTIE